ncbi:Uncharacterised protein [Klebsiella pneumoniae]|nr:Uncharacterised protein [Klebsiella pneumoniae]SLP11241.1 Uncharacterised protein [Klebsiella pneumoniae]SLP23549.1 Uncharacterised protein [Klebsiella pneumoniae]SLP27019.1 Uncharacterised protein [Klebsiella pneumoniae]
MQALIMHKVVLQNMVSPISLEFYVETQDFATKATAKARIKGDKTGGKNILILNGKILMSKDDI